MSALLADPAVYETLLSVFNAGQYQDAERIASELVGKFPEDPRLHAVLGGCLNALDRPQEAIPSFHKALALKPGYTDAFYNLGIAHYLSHDYPAAVVTYRDLLALRPDYAPAWNSLALALQHVEDFDPDFISATFRSAYASFLQKFQAGVMVAPSADLITWCNANQIEVEVLDSPCEVDVVDAENASSAGYRNDGARVVSIPGASFIPGWDFVIAPDGHVLNSSGYMDLSVPLGMPHLYHRPTGQVVHVWPSALIDVDEDALFLSAPPDLHFGHWVIDFLPRLRAWQTTRSRPGKVAVSSSLPLPHRQALAAFCVAEADVIWCDVAKCYRFRSLAVAQMGTYMRPHPNTTKFLHAALGRDAIERPALGKRRLFLARSGTKRGRFIVNQDALQQVLDEMGFETVRRPEIAVPDQNRLFAETAIVITTFGTDIITVYQLKPGTDLVVLCPPGMSGLDIVSGTMMLASVCQTLGLRLHRLECKAVDGTVSGNAYQHNLIVDCQMLRQRLRQIAQGAD